MKAKIKSDELNRDTKIYRYMNLVKFKSLLKTNKLYLVSVDRWDDPFDNLCKKCIVSDITSGKMIYHESIHAQCWTLKEESDAMWRIYGNNDGIKIQTTLAKLADLNYPKRAEIRKVIYTDQLKANDFHSSPYFLEGYFGTVFLKRQAFSHEEEIRVATEGNQEGETLVDIDLKDFIEEVVITSRANKSYEDMIINLCNTYGLKYRKSDLYGDHDYDIGEFLSQCDYTG